MRIGVGLSIPELSTRGGRFSPASLFTGGVQGAWYDPSDYSTLFQDSAGTSPVTAVEQPVGLMLDKSQGLVLGSEQIATPFSVSGAGWSAVSNTAVATSTTATGTVPTTATLATTKRYQVSFTASSLSGATCFVNMDSSVAALTKRIATAGNYTFILFGAGAANIQFQAYEGTAFSVTISNLSIKEIPGNHASQATAASRPVLRARYNLLTYSEQFDNAVWSKLGSTITANASTAPDGTSTADKLVESAAAGFHYTTQNISVTGAVFSVYVKAAERTQVALFLGGISVGVGFDLLTGTTTTISGWSSGAPTSSITSVGGGWYRITIYTAGAITNVQLGIGNAGAGSYTGDGTSGIFVWGADLRTGSSAGTYQRIAAATDYATAGFLPYLAADGSDDQMSIPSAAISAATAITEMHAAWRPAGFGAANGVVFGSTGTATVNDHEPFSDGNLYYGFSSTAREAFGSLGTVTIPYILDATQTGTTLAVNKNGTQLSTTKTVSIGIGSSPRLFAANNATIQFWAGNFFGGLLIKKVLSASEMTALRSWLAAKSGVVL